MHPRTSRERTPSASKRQTPLPSHRGSSHKSRPVATPQNLFHNTTLNQNLTQKRTRHLPLPKSKALNETNPSLQKQERYGIVSRATLRSQSSYDASKYTTCLPDSMRKSVEKTESNSNRENLNNYVLSPIDLKKLESTVSFFAEKEFWSPKEVPEERMSIGSHKNSEEMDQTFEFNISKHELSMSRLEFLKKIQPHYVDGSASKAEPDVQDDDYKHWGARKGAVCMKTISTAYSENSSGSKDMSSERLKGSGLKGLVTKIFSGKKQKNSGSFCENMCDSNHKEAGSYPRAAYFQELIEKYQYQDHFLATENESHRLNTSMEISESTFSNLHSPRQYDRIYHRANLENSSKKEIAPKPEDKNDHEETKLKDSYYYNILRVNIKLFGGL